MKETLAYVNERLVEAGKFLSEFTGEKLECTQTFCKCQKIVQWIRNTTKGVQSRMYMYLYSRQCMNFSHFLSSCRCQ